MSTIFFVSSLQFRFVHSWNNVLEQHIFFGFFRFVHGFHDLVNYTIDRCLDGSEWGGSTGTAQSDGKALVVMGSEEEEDGATTTPSKRQTRSATRSQWHDNVSILRLCHVECSTNWFDQGCFQWFSNKFRCCLCDGISVCTNCFHRLKFLIAGPIFFLAQFFVHFLFSNLTPIQNRDTFPIPSFLSCRRPHFCCFLLLVVACCCGCFLLGRAPSWSKQTVMQQQKNATTKIFGATGIVHTIPIYSVISH